MPKVIKPCTAKEININVQAIFFLPVNEIRGLVYVCLFTVFHGKAFDDKDIADGIRIHAANFGIRFCNGLDQNAISIVNRRYSR